MGCWLSFPFLRYYICLFPTSLRGVLASGSVSRRLLRRLLPPPPANLPHNSSTHNLLTHTTCPHRTCSHTTCPHTTCSHTTCPHTTCPHTTCSHTTCPHTTCLHTTCPHATCFHTTCPHTTCPHTTCLHTSCFHTELVLTQLAHTQLAHTQLVHTQIAHTQLAHTQLVHTQLPHTTSRLTLLRGRRGTYGTGLAPMARVGRSGMRGRCGCWRGRRGIWRHARWFHVAGAALGDGPHTTCPRTQLACTQLVHTQIAHTQLAHTQLVHTQLPHTTSRFTLLRGRRGTYGTWAGSDGALGPEWGAGTLRLLAWQVWHLATCTLVPRGRRGARWHRHPPSYHVAGLRITWQAWCLVTSTSTFAWQAWHVWHWAGYDGALGPEWDAGTLRLLAWQAWHLATCTLVPRGRRGTRWHRHPPSFHVARVLLGDIDFHFCVAGVARMALGWLRWRAWAGVGRGDAAAVGVAGVAFGDMHLGSTWEAWHSVTSTFTFVSRGRRGTWWHRLPLLRGRRLHANTFTHKSFYTQKLLHRDTFSHRNFYTEALLHTITFTQTYAFTHRSFYTQTLLHIGRPMFSQQSHRRRGHLSNPTGGCIKWSDSKPACINMSWGLCALGPPNQRGLPFPSKKV